VIADRWRRCVERDCAGIAKINRAIEERHSDGFVHIADVALTLHRRNLLFRPAIVIWWLAGGSARIRLFPESHDQFQLDQRDAISAFNIELSVWLSKW